jgi:hypothetical protein
MKEQTAMQILLDSINKELKSNSIKDIEYYGGLEDVKDYILENLLLEKEKEQIKDAVDYGKLHFGDIAEDYYNKTFNK